MARQLLLLGALLLTACARTPDAAGQPPGPPAAPAATFKSEDARTPSVLVGNVSVPLTAGWNAVGLQGERLVTLAGTVSVAGMAWFNGSGYVTQSLSVDNVDGRRGLWIFASTATSFTYSAEASATPQLSLTPGWNLVSFMNREPQPGSSLIATQNGRTVPLGSVLLPTFTQLNNDNRYATVDVTQGGVLQPGRPYWVFAQSAVTLSWMPAPPGQARYRLTEYASVPRARHLALNAEGTLFVGTNADSVYAVRGPGQVVRLLQGLNGPNSVCVDGDDLLVGEVDAVWRYRGLSRTLTAGSRELVCRLTPDRNHGMRFLRYGADRALYIVSGYPGNVGPVADPYGTILRLLPGQSQPEVYVRGIRNSMGFDWHPQTGEMWFSDNGRDWLGDDQPPEELNRVERAGQHFGFPFRHGALIVDPEMGSQAPPGLVMTPPAVDLQAHVAPLGIEFYRGTMFPPDDQGKLMVCTHGSWNRSSPVGYEVLLVDTSTGARKVLVGGWLQPNGQPTNRPVDVEMAADGSVFLSDDYGGKIFRITYGP